MNKPLFVLGAFFLLFWGCQKVEPIWDNPFDPDNPDYERPQIVIVTGPGDGDTVTTSYTDFTWKGNSSYMEFRTKLDSNAWNMWMVIHTRTFRYLDEGSHTFYVQSRYTAGDTSEVATVTFITDAVSGPALRFFPRRRTAAVGETVTFQIMAEEVDSLTAVELHFGMDTNQVEIISLSQGPYLLNNGQSIFHYEANGDITVLEAMLGGNESSVSGTGSLANVKLRLLQANDVQLTFTGSQILKGPDNQPIPVMEVIGGYIEVQ